MINKMIMDQLTVEETVELKKILKEYGDTLKAYSDISSELTNLMKIRDRLSGTITELRDRERAFIAKLQERPDFDVTMLMEELIKNKNNDVQDDISDNR